MVEFQKNNVVSQYRIDEPERLHIQRPLSVRFSMQHRNRKLFKHQQVCVGMATKNISITEEAYMRLASLRKGNESFSEIINKVTRKTSLLRFAGILSKESGDRLEKNIQQLRQNYNRDAKHRLQKLLKQMGKDGVS